MCKIFAKLLNEIGLTAYAVSKATGITQSTLSNWKNRNSIPREGTLIQIANYLGVSVAYLKGETNGTYGHKKAGDLDKAAGYKVCTFACTYFCWS